MDGKRVTQDSLLDRISDLPNNVIDIILSHVTLRVAVQTSTLSRKWRLHWTRVDNLVLDEDFTDENDIFLPSTYVNIVGNILLCHSGPIRKLVLSVRYIEDEDIQVADANAINFWMLAVSQRGVQDLTLNYCGYYEYCKVPPHVFQCTELKHLSLQNVIHPPIDFGALSSLLSLDLSCDAMSEDLLTHIFLKCPLLERLSLCYEDNNGHFDIDASKLKVLSLICYRYHHSDFFLKNTPNLSTITMTLIGIPRVNRNIKCQDILDFFGALPKLENFTLTGDLLEEWGAQDVPKMLSAPLEILKDLSVNYVNMYSPAQVRSMLCITKSSPILRTLHIYSVCKPGPPLHITSDYLKAQIDSSENVWSLKTVKIKGLLGMEPEIVFIKMILACCPVLETLYLTTKSSVTSDAELKMVTNIMRFRRASAQAELIYSKQEY